MLRPCLAMAVLLTVGCDDGPTAPDVARAPPTTGLAVDAVAAINRLLDDPFVHDVIAQTDPSVQRTMQNVMDHVAAGEPQALRRVLTEAHSSLQESSDDEAVVAHAALGLTLRAVETVLDSGVRAQTNENDAVPTRRSR